MILPPASATGRTSRARGSRRQGTRQKRVLAGIYAGLLGLLLAVAIPLRLWGLTLPTLQTAVTLPNQIFDLEASGWRQPDDLDPLRFVDQERLDCDGAFACLVDDGDHYQQERIGWEPRQVSGSAMFCLTPIPVAENDPDLSFGVRFFVAAIDSEQPPARLTAQIGHTSGFSRITGDHPLVEHDAAWFGDRLCYTMTAREPVSLGRITVFPAIGETSFSSAAEGRLHIRDMAYYESDR